MDVAVEHAAKLAKFGGGRVQVAAERVKCYASFPSMI
jgi:hypothetical protein